MYCLHCDQDRHPVHTFDPSGKIREACPGCGQTFAVVGAKTERLPPPPPPPSLPKAVAHDIKVHEAASSFETILSEAKARLATIKLELARMALLQKEEARLERMILAAESSETPN